MFLYLPATAIFACCPVESVSQLFSGVTGAGPLLHKVRNKARKAYVWSTCTSVFVFIAKVTSVSSCFQKPSPLLWINDLEWNFPFGLSLEESNFLIRQSRVQTQTQ